MQSLKARWLFLLLLASTAAAGEDTVAHPPAQEPSKAKHKKYPNPHGFGFDDDLEGAR